MTTAERAWPGAAVARAEDTVALAAAAGVVLLPLSEVVLRRLFSTGIPGSAPFMFHLTLVLGLVGAAIAAREGKLLTLATGTLIPEGRWRHLSGVLAAAVGVCVSTVLGASAVRLIQAHREAGFQIGFGVPIWWADLAFPAAFALIVGRLIWRSSPVAMGRLLAATGVIVGLWLATHLDVLADGPVWPWIALLLGATVLGMPLFALIGGIAVVVFLGQALNPAGVLSGAYSQLTSTDVPAIPLFTIAGSLLAAGRSSERLLRFFRAFFGWMPGGTAVVTTVFCAFFTLFTGGSGVTILALGGLLLPALLADGYRERFSLGMLTAAGSLGLLFPPSLPLIMFGFVGEVEIQSLFIGGFLPGVLMLGALSAMGVREGLVQGRPRQSFAIREAAQATWLAKWELLLPVVIIGSLLYGATPVQSAALAALFAFIVQRFIHRSVTSLDNLRQVMGTSIALLGGILIILSVAKGFTQALIFADLPQQLGEWTVANVHSPWVFLLGLNGVLILAGAAMDIFSAIVILVPLVAPIAIQSFGIHPVHLGVIFIANSELGYLTPPVGENLFVASYRFNRPIMQLARAMVPMYVVLLVGVLLITYWPWLTTGLLGWFGR